MKMVGSLIAGLFVCLGAAAPVVCMNALGAPGIFIGFTISVLLGGIGGAICAFLWEIDL